MIDSGTIWVLPIVTTHKHTRIHVSPDNQPPLTCHVSPPELFGCIIVFRGIVITDTQHQKHMWPLFQKLLWVEFRDSVMGGTPFSDPRMQGVVTGLSTDIRMDIKQGSCLDMLERLLEYSDWLRLSLAAGLRDYVMTDRFGKNSRGSQVKSVCMICFLY